MKNNRRIIKRILSIFMTCVAASFLFGSSLASSYLANSGTNYYYGVQGSYLSMTNTNNYNGSYDFGTINLNDTTTSYTLEIPNFFASTNSKYWLSLNGESTIGVQLGAGVSGSGYYTHIGFSRGSGSSVAVDGYSYNYNQTCTISVSVSDIDAAVGTHNFSGTLYVVQGSGSVYSYVDSHPYEFTINVTGTNPPYTIPSGITATYGDTLGSIKLPTGYSWKQSLNTVLNKAGSVTYYATYSKTGYTNSVSNIPITINIAPYQVRFKVEVP